MRWLGLFSIRRLCLSSRMRALKLILKSNRNKWMRAWRILPLSFPLSLPSRSPLDQRFNSLCLMAAMWSYSILVSRNFDFFFFFPVGAWLHFLLCVCVCVCVCGFDSSLLCLSFRAALWCGEIPCVWLSFDAISFGISFGISLTRNVFDWLCQQGATDRSAFASRKWARRRGSRARTLVSTVWICLRTKATNSWSRRWRSPSKRRKGSARSSSSLPSFFYYYYYYYYFHFFFCWFVCFVCLIVWWFLSLLEICGGVVEPLGPSLSVSPSLSLCIIACVYRAMRVIVSVIVLFNVSFPECHESSFVGLFFLCVRFIWIVSSRRKMKEKMIAV